jgi:hypothetical protein
VLVALEPALELVEGVVVDVDVSGVVVDVLLVPGVLLLLAELEGVAEVPRLSDVLG